MPSAKSAKKPVSKKKPLPEPAAEWVATGELKAWPDNPRRNDGRPVNEVVRSIKRFGFGAPILARRENREVIAGHTRLKAALELRMPKVPVRYLDLGPDEAHLLALADNRVGELADWDDDRLGNLLRTFDAEGIDLDSLGWTENELADLLTDGSPMESTGDDDAPGVTDGPADSKLGEVYELGPHRLACGDSRSSEAWDALVVTPNIVFTSPPYASQRTYDESSGFKPIKPDDYVDWWEPLQAQVADRLAPDGSFFVNIKAHCEDGQRHLYVNDLVSAHVRKWDWLFIDELCWTRSGVPGRWNNRFKNGWEPIYHFGRGDIGFFDPVAVGHPSDDVLDYHPDNPKTHSGFLSAGGGQNGGRSGTALPSNVLTVTNHPTQIAAVDGASHTATFPVSLPEFFLKAYCPPGGIACDPFMGSGTTLIAAAKTGRIGYGIEISPHYCDVIRKRWTKWATENGQDVGSGGL